MITDLKDLEKKIREEIEICKSIIKEKEEKLENVKGWDEGYLKGVIAGLKREIRRLKEILGDKDDF